MRLIKDFDNWSMATFIVRWILGLLFLMAGIGKVFDMGAIEHARHYFVDPYANSWIPAMILWIFGLVIPYLELFAGILLCIGLKVRITASVLGVLLIITTYGHALKDALFDIDGHTFTRLALIVFLLLAPAGRDVLTLDYWFGRNDDGKAASAG